MKVIIQRVSSAECKVNNLVTGKIDKGYMILVGFSIHDSLEDLSYLDKCARKINNLRIFEDESGKLNKSITDINGSILSISQFTLYADPYSGNRPSFTESMKFEDAKNLYHKFNEILRNTYMLHVEEGIFGEDMKITQTNDGPVTIELEF